MKKLALLFVLALSVNGVMADNLFQTSNPFPQTVPQSMNNIYESEPAIMQKEAKQEKKSWFRKGRNLEKQDKEQNLNTFQVNEGAKEGVNEGSFYMFK